MKTYKYKAAGTFPEGTKVGAYLESNWALHFAPTGEPEGEATEEATVESGELTFSELLPGTTYWLVGEVGGDYRYVKFTTDSVGHVAIAATSDGDNTVIAAVPGKSIRVIGYAINVNAAGTCQFQDSAAESPEVFAAFEFPDGGGATYSGSRADPAFEVVPGLALEVKVAEGVDATGHVTYELVG